MRRASSASPVEGLGLGGLAAPDVQKRGEVHVALRGIRVLGPELLLEGRLRRPVRPLGLVHPVQLVEQNGKIAQMRRGLDVVLAEKTPVGLVNGALELLGTGGVSLPEAHLRDVAADARRGEPAGAVPRLDEG